MKGIDYTKALGRDREIFQDTLQKTQKAADRRVAESEDRAEHVMKKQRENFVEDKLDMENTVQKNMKKMDEKVKAALDNNNNNQEKEMQEEREAFSRDAITKRKDFEQRLNDITSSYKKSFDVEKGSHTDQLETNKKRYSNNIQDENTKITNKLSEYQTDMSKSGAQLKDQYKRERQQLVRGHEDHLFEVQKASGNQRAELKERINSDVRKTKEIHAAEGEQTKAYTADRLHTLQKGYEDRYQKLANDYSNRSDSLVETQQKDAVKTNKEHQQHLADVRRAHNKQFRMIELEKRRRDNGSGEFADVINRQKGMKDEMAHEGRVKDLKSQLSNAKKVFSDKSEQDQDSFNESFRREATEATARLDRKLNEVNAEKITTVSNEREKTVKEIGNREHQNKLDKMAFEHSLNVEKKNSSNKVAKLKENFVQSMRELDEKQKISVEDVTKVSNQDKAEFVKKVNEARSKEIFAMQRDFAKLMDTTVQDYEGRLANYQRDNEYLSMTMNQKIQNITDMSEKQMESQRVLFEDRRSADIQNHQILMDEKDYIMKSNMTQVTASFQKKLDKMQVESDTKLKLLTNEYENKLATLKASTSKELAQKDTTHQIELARIKMSYEEDKSRIIAGYDAQIQTTKNQHRDQLEEMKNYNKLA